jgi:hypothetical protein
MKHSKMRNPHDKSMVTNPNAEEITKPTKANQKDKWEHLQRRIRELR